MEIRRVAEVNEVLDAVAGHRIHGVGSIPQRTCISPVTDIQAASARWWREIGIGIRLDGLLVSVLKNMVPARHVQPIQRRWRRGHLGYTSRHRRR